MKHRILVLVLAGMLTAAATACGSTNGKTSKNADAKPTVAYKDMQVGETATDLKADLKILTNRTDLVDSDFHIRSEVRIAHKEYYGLDTSNNNVPDLSTEPALAEWGRKIVDGENKRISQGGIPIYNPTIAKVRVHYDIFMDSYEKQKNLQSLTARSLDTLASMRAEADGLILDIWNQVEKKFEEVTPNEKRLDLCRDYGIIYYYRTGEKRKE